MKPLLILIYSAISIFGFSQEVQPLEIGEVLTIQSKVLNEERILNVYVPQSYYQDSTKEYPVIYVLDGSIDEDMIHIVGVSQFISFPWINDMEEAIVVGISNVNRKRDYTFPITYPISELNFPNEVDKSRFDFTKSGKSDSFISFIETELIPLISNRYRVSPQRTLIGQSLGGLLATEILLKHPSLFTDYLIVSPSLWWNNESLLNDITAINDKVKVYLTVGKNEPSVMIKDAKKLNKNLNHIANCEVVGFEIEKWADHGNILHDAVKKGLIQLNK